MLELTSSGNGDLVQFLVGVEGVDIYRAVLSYVLTCFNKGGSGASPRPPKASEEHLLSVHGCPGIAVERRHIWSGRI